VPMAFVDPREREVIDRQERMVAPGCAVQRMAPRMGLLLGSLAGREREVRP